MAEITKDSTSQAGAGIHLLTSDLLVADKIIDLPDSQKLKTLSPKDAEQYEKFTSYVNEILAAKNMKAGDKLAINHDEFQALEKLSAYLPSELEAGGATAGISTTVKNLLGNNVSIDFIGLAGKHGAADRLMTGDLHDHGITLSPSPADGEIAATSLILKNPNGKNTILTYAGTADEKASPALISDEKIAKAGSVIIPISLWSKFKDEYADTLLNKAVAQDKQIILTIPKQARFGYKGDNNIHKKLIEHADVIAADESELARWYNTGGDHEAALRKLAEDIEQRDILRKKEGKPQRTKPVAAFIKHSDDSATILVSASGNNAAQRIEISPPPSVAGKKHNIGVDDSMYAGFITGIVSGLDAQKAGAFAAEVGQAKYLHDNVRIPAPSHDNAQANKQWGELRSSLSGSISSLQDAFTITKTGVSNPNVNSLQRTTGQKAFDNILYQAANLGVIAGSMLVTYHSNFNQNKANAFVKRSAWFKDKLTKLPGIGESPQMVRNLNMVAWSFIDGSAMSPVVAAFESKRQPISHWIDKKLGTEPEDKSVYDKEIHRSWGDIFKARATTFALVIATYFTLNAKIFPNSMKEGILNESAAGNGVFQREKVQSINGVVFDAPGKKIGGWLAEVPWINKWASKTSENQLAGMAAKTGTIARKPSKDDILYQVEGVVNTGLFEAAYSSLCTAGLFFLGKNFAKKRQEKVEHEETTVPAQVSPRLTENTDSQEQKKLHSFASEELKKKLPAHFASHAEFAEKNASEYSLSL